MSRYACAAGADSSVASSSTARATLSGRKSCGVSCRVCCQRVAPNSAAGAHPSGQRRAIATRWLPIGSCGHPCAMWRCSSMRAGVPGDAAIPRVARGVGAAARSSAVPVAPIHTERRRPLFTIAAKQKSRYSQSANPASYFPIESKSKSGRPDPTGRPAPVLARSWPSPTAGHTRLVGYHIAAVGYSDRSGRPAARPTADWSVVSFRCRIGCNSVVDLVRRDPHNCLRFSDNRTGAEYGRVTIRILHTVAMDGLGSAGYDANGRRIGRHMTEREVVALPRTGASSACDRT